MRYKKIEEIDVERMLGDCSRDNVIRLFLMLGRRCEVFFQERAKKYYQVRREYLNVKRSIKIVKKHRNKFSTKLLFLWSAIKELDITWLWGIKEYEEFLVSKYWNCKRAMKYFEENEKVVNWIYEFVEKIKYAKDEDLKEMLLEHLQGNEKFIFNLKD